MKLEDLNEQNVKLLSDHELRNMRERANQLWCAERSWSEQIEKRCVGISQPIQKDRLFEIYELILDAMQRRHLSSPVSELDRKLVSKKMRGLDVAELPILRVKSSVVAVAGDFVASPINAKTVQVYVDADEFGNAAFTLDLEKRVAELLTDQTGKPVVVHRDAVGFSSPVISVFDLLLVPRSVTKIEEDIADLEKRLAGRKEENSYEHLSDSLLSDSKKSVTLDYVSKPYPNEHAARQNDPSKYDSFRRVNNKLGSGISVIFGIKDGKSEIQSIRFSASKFTPAEARKWLKAHDYKTTLEPAKKKVKKSVVAFVKNEEERIVGGVVYGLGSFLDVDAQGDFVDEMDEIYKAMKYWMISGHVMKFMHNGKEVNTPLIECFLAEEPTVKYNQPLEKGDWFISNYVPEDEEDLWDAVKAGDISGYSMAGSAEAEVYTESEDT